MVKRFRRLFLFALAVALQPVDLQACSFAIVPPTTDQLDDTSAFTGVVQQAGIYPLPGTSNPAPAIEVAVAETIVGERGSGLVRVYLMGYGTDCEEQPESGTVLERFPKGTTVTVIADVRESPDGRPYLEARQRNFGFVASVPSYVARTSSGSLNFRRFQSEYQQNPYSEWSADIAQRNADRSYFEDFEYLQALRELRLGGRAERTAVALNLLYYSGWRNYRLKWARFGFERLLAESEVPIGARVALRQTFKKVHRQR